MKNSSPRILAASILLLALTAFTGMHAQAEWQTSVEGIYTFSSTRAADLNGDGTQDFVLGAGVEGAGNDYGVLAFDGADGDLLWNVYSRDQIFGSPIFQDISEDGTPDVFIGGRKGEMMAIDGDSGEIIWEFFAAGDSVNPGDFDVWQFYTPQWVPDQNNDGVQDLLVANGGDPSALLPNDPRPAGRIMILDGLTGVDLGSAHVPDGQETYMSPLLVEFWPGEPEVLFGTGGETEFGSLYRAPLSAVISGDLTDATVLLAGDVKGFVAPPSVADMNADNVLDIVSHSYDGRITVINGIDNSILWEVLVENAETNASPGIGFFNDDDIPDVFSAFGLGQAPSLTEFTQLMIDGATGEVLWRDSIGLAQFSSPVVFDADNDGFDEVFFNANEAVMDPFYFVHEISLIDFNDDEISSIYGPVGGGNVNSTPWLGDADEDGMMELVYPFLSDSSQLVIPGGLEMIRINLPYESAEVSWGAYLGTDYSGVFENPRSNCDEEYTVAVEVLAGGCASSVSATSTGCPEGDCTVAWSNGAVGSTVEFYELGDHYVTLTHADGCVKVARFNIDGLDNALEATIQTENSVCAGSGDGYFRADWTGGTPPYSVIWNGVPSGGTTNSTLYIIPSLEIGTYTFEIEDAQGCKYEEMVVIEGPEVIDAGFEFELPTTSSSFDGSITLEEPTGGFPPYLITNEFNSPVFAEMPITDLSSGIYQFTIKDQMDCEKVITIDLQGTGIEEQIDELVQLLLSEDGNTLAVDVAKNLQITQGVRILNVGGQTCKIFNNSVSSSSERLRLDISDLPVGTYLLDFSIEEKRLFKKFMIVR